MNVTITHMFPDKNKKQRSALEVAETTPWPQPATASHIQIEPFFNIKTEMGYISKEDRKVIWHHVYNLIQIMDP